MNRTVLGLVGVVTVGLAAPGKAEARPTGPTLVCERYPELPACSGSVPDCRLCHTSTDPVGWNDYGLALLAELDGAFDEQLDAALVAIEGDDSDADGLTNLEELQLGTSPGWVDTASCGDVTGYDVGTAYRRVSVLYCGRSPSFDEWESLQELSGADASAQLHIKLDECLASSYWRNVGLARVADPIVQPLEAVGLQSEVGITIGDYVWDYNLFRYVMSDGRDLRELLLADYHVSDDGSTFTLVEGTFDSPRGGAGGQPLEPARRAGMLTTQWFLARNTMFSPLPRTSAAAAYRLFLGLDIAQQQGLWPIAGEPLDVDNSGVDAPECAQCHSTLDPLSYAFAVYEGIAGSSSGIYRPERAPQDIPGWTDPGSYLFGEPVDDVVAWAQTAANSDAFARTMATYMYRHALGRDPTPQEWPEFEAWWQTLPTQDWSMNALLHGLVELPAFGGAA